MPTKLESQKCNINSIVDFCCAAMRGNVSLMTHLLLAVGEAPPANSRPTQDMNVSSLRHAGALSSGYGVAMREDVTSEGAPFADLLRGARRDAGLLQEDVIQRSGVSRSTYLRWEAGDVGRRPDLDGVRAVCRVLDVNPRSAAIALGLVTPSELGLTPDGSEYDPIIVEINLVLTDSTVPGPARAALRHTLAAALNLWRTAVAMPEPREPSRTDLTKRRSAKR